jgi:hypothetical protein
MGSLLLETGGFFWSEHSATFLVTNLPKGGMVGAIDVGMKVLIDVGFRFAIEVVIHYQDNSC